MARHGANPYLYTMLNMKSVKVAGSLVSLSCLQESSSAILPMRTISLTAMNKKYPCVDRLTMV